MPVVTQTTERSGERPVAKALGTSMSATPTRGLGMSASAHEPVDHAVQLGRLLRGHLAGAHRLHGDGVGEVPLPPGDADADERR